MNSFTSFERRARRITRLGLNSLRRQRREWFKRVCVVLMAATSLCVPARAGTVTWDGGSTAPGDTSWGNLGNWDTTVPTSADDLVFVSPIPNPNGLANPGTITVGAAAVANSLTFNDNYTFTGGMLTLSNSLDGNSGKITVAAGKTTVIGSVLGGSPLITKLGTGTLDLTGTNTYDGGTVLSEGTLRIGNDSALGTGSLTVNTAGTTLSSTSGTGRTLANNLNLSADLTLGQATGGTGALTFTGSMDLGGTRVITNVSDVVFNGQISNGDLTKAGAGMMTLGGANVYGGATLVSGGELRITSSSALDGTSSITVADTAALSVSGGISVNKSITITGQGGTLGALRSTVGNNSWDGNITLGADGTRIGTGIAGSSFTINGVIDSGTNNYGLAIRTSDPADVVTLTNQNTYKGGTTVIVGTLKLASGNDRLPTGTTLTLGNTSNVAAATADLNGVNQTVAGIASLGTTMVNTITNTSGTASTLTLGGTGATTYSGIVAGNLSLVKSGTGTQTLTGSNTYSGNISVTGGALVAGKTASLPGYTTAGRISVASGGILGVRMGSAGEWTETDVAALTGVSPSMFASGAYLGIEPSVANYTYATAISGSQGLAKLSTANVLTLSAANTYTGGTLLVAGTLEAANNNALGTGTVTASSLGNSARLRLGNGVTISNPLVMNAVDPAAGYGTLQGPTTGSATYSGPITINVDSTSGGHIAGGTGLNITGTLTTAGTATAIVIRAGNVTLSNPTGNSYPLLRISAGNVTLGATNAIVTTAGLEVATVAAESGSLNLNNFDQTVASLVLGGGTATVTTGTGTLTINGGLTYTGNNAASISGNLSLGGATRTMNIADGTAFPDLRIAANISNGGITKTGAGTLDLAGANTYAGGTTLSAGTLRVGSNSALGTGNLTIGAPNLTVSANGAVPITLSNGLAINNDVSFGQASGGTGNLTFGGAVNLGGGAPRTITTLNTTTFSGAVTNGALTKAGTGTLVISGNATLGAVNVTTGTLSLTGSNTLSSTVDVASGATLSASTASALSGATSINIAGGATFSFGSGAATTLAPTAMTIGGTTAANLRFLLGSGYDKISTGSPITVNTGGAVISGTAIAGFGAGTYNLLAAGSGLSGGAFTLGTLPGGYTYSLSTSDTAVTLNAAVAASGAYYWRGDNGTSWATLGGGTNTNWSTDVAGTTDALATPGALNDVVFSTNNAGATAITTTLDNAFSVQSLKFISNGTGAVTLNAGTGGSLSIGSGGLELQVGAGLPTINAPINLAANQRWNINNAATNVGVIVNNPLSGSATLTKVGNARLELNNVTSGVASTNTGGINFLQGELLLRLAAMGAADGPVVNPAGSGDIVLAAPGGTFYVRMDGDDSTTNRDYFFSNNLIVNEPITINVDRVNAGANGRANKNFAFSSLTINDTQLTITQNNNHRFAVSGNINLIGSSVINAGDMTNMITGKITDAGKVLTLNKVGGNTFNVLGTGNDFSGGYIAAGGTTRVGDGYGTSVTNDAATLGTGPVVINPGARVRFHSATNIAAGQTIDVISNPNNIGAIEIGDNTFPTQLRAFDTGVFQVFASNFDRSIDMSRLGDGTWRLGSSTTGTSGTITGGSITPGAGNVYRLGGGGNTLTISPANYFTGSASLDVGGEFINGATPAGSSTVLLTEANNYTGATTVERGSTLRFQKGGATGSSLGTTSGLTVYGTITAESSGSNHGTFFNSTGAIIPVTLMGGSKLYLDNNAITTAGLDVNRWDNATPIAMNQLDFEIRSRNVAAADVTTEDVGAISVANGNILRLTRSQSISGHNLVLQADSLSRIGAGTLEIVRNTGTGAGLGGGQKFLLDSGAPTPVNGMVTPWVVNFTDKSHVTYGANGFASVAYGVTDINTATATGLVNSAGAALTADRSMYALKQTGALTGAFTATIGSGGLIADFTGTSGTPVSLTNTVKLTFNDGTANVEGAVFVDDNDTLVQSAAVTAAGLTKFGGGTLSLTTSNATTLTGTISVNRGTLQLEDAAAAGGRPIVVTAGGTLNLRQAVATTYTSGITLAQDNPVANISVGRTGTTADNITFTVPTLTLAGSAGAQGQTLNFTSGNNFDLLVSGATAVTGNATFHANSGGGELYLDGGFTSNTAGATLVKSGGQVMRIIGNSNTVAANTKFQINGGTLELRSTNASTDAAFNTLGDGANTTIYLNTGTLALRTAGAGGTFGGTSATAGGYNVVVSGNSTIDVGRYTGSNTDKRLRIGNLTIGSQILNVTTGSGFYLAVNGTTAINGDPTFNTTAPIPELIGKVSGGRIIKTGTSTLRLSAADNVNTYDGGSITNQGWLYGYNTRGLGTGDVIVNPGGGLALGKATVLQGSQKAILRSNSWALAMVGQNYGTSTAPSTMLANLDLTRAGVGVFAGGGNYVTPLDMSDLFGATVSGDDDWYLGGISYSDTYYRADTFLASTTGNTYRLGGGGGNMQINRNNATPNTGVAGTNANNVLTDLNSGATATSVTIGMPAQNLRGHQSSEVLIAGTQNYTGGTVINRGTTLHLATAATATNSGAGTGNIDVYGVLDLRTAGTLTNGSGGNVNTVTTHPGARILLDSNTTSIAMNAVEVGDRWGNNASVDLDGARFYLNGKNVAGLLQETIGAVNFSRGSSITADRNYGGTAGPPVVPGSRVYLTMDSVNRVGSGTLLLVTGDGKLPTVAALDGEERYILSGAIPTITSGMVAPYIIDSNGGRFVTYNSSTAADGNVIGFQQVDFDKTISTGTYTAGSLLTTDKVAFSAAATLSDNPTIYALKLAAGVSASGSNNTITIRSGGLIGSAGTTNANLVFNNGSSNIEALMSFTGNTVLQGTVTATQVTKFGYSELQLDRATPVFTAPLVINNGAVRALQLGALTTAPITLNGSGSGNGDDASGTGLFFAANIASSEEQVYTHGDVTAYDNNRILFITGGDDRIQRAGNFILATTPGNNLSVAQFRMENKRQRISVNSIAFNSPEAILNVVNNNYGSGGASSVFAPSSLIGNAKTVTKLGSGMLELSNMSGMLTNSTLNVAQGALRVVDGASLGSNNVINIEQGTALEIAGANFAVSGTVLNQNWGSGERWNVENARGTGNYTVPNGVNLQINTNILPSTPRTITLDGGSIEGYLYNDSAAKAVFRTLNSNVTINLASNSYIGQNLNVGLYGSDAGVQGLYTNDNPLTGDARGAILVVNGPITGSTSDLTKTGRDAVVLAGTNTYRNTIIDQGLLRLGKNDTLPTAGALTPRFTGMLDLNGFNQTVGNIGTSDAAANPGGVGVGYSGTIANSAYNFNTLTFGNADNYTYNGNFQGNIALVKQGAGETRIAGTNAYTGSTVVNAGLLYIASNAPAQLVSSSTNVANNAGIVLPYGGAGRLDDAGVTTIRTIATLGTNLTIGFDVADTYSYTYSTLFPTATGIIKGGLGTLVLPTASAWPKGISLRGGTTEFAAGALGTTETIQLQNSNTIRWSTGNTENISARLSALPGSALTTFDTGTNNVNFTAPLTGALGSMNKSGTGTLSLAGANTYTGATTISQGTLAMTVDQNMTDGLTFGATPGTTTTGTLDLTTSNATFAGSLLVQTNSATANTITLGASKTLSFSGPASIGSTIALNTTALTVNGGAGSALNIGGGLTISVPAAGTTSSLTTTGTNVSVTGAMNIGTTTGAAALPAGTLTVSGGSFTANLGTGAMNVGVRTTTAATSTTTGVIGLVDLSNATSVSITGTTNASSILLGSNTAASTNTPGDVAQGTLKLSTAGTNTVSVGTLTLGTSPNTGQAGILGYLVLGNAINNLNIDTIYVGRQKSQAVGSSVATLSFAGSGGTLNLAGFAGGAAKSNLNVGYNDNANTGTVSVGNVDLSNGSFNGTLGTITLGLYAGTGSGGGKGTLTIGGGSTTADAIILSTAAGSTSAANNAGTLILNGGTLTLAATGTGITNGGGTTVSGTATVTLNGGTLDMSARNIGSATSTVVFNAQSGTLKNLAQLNGGANLDKTTAGTLNMTGTHTYSGATNVLAGTLQVGTPSSAGSIASSSGVNVASSASFVAGSNTTVKSLNLSASNANASILAGALRILTVGDGTSDTGLLDISGSGSKLDLNSGAVVLNFNSAGVGTSLRDTIKNLIGTGKIMSSRAVAANLVDPNTPVGIGYALGDYTSVGLPSDATSIVARYTLVGDANLDGVVDVGDLGTALAPNYGSPSGNYWQSGDFNGDGAVDTSDLALLAANYGKTLTLPGEPVGNLNLNVQQDLAQAFASVPEPGTLSVLGLAALALLKRRNRKAA